MTSTEQQFVRLERPRPGVALVTLNRPDRMNAMAFDVMIPLKDTLHVLSQDNEVRVVVLTGAGRGFCSGADQKSSGAAVRRWLDAHFDRAAFDAGAR